MSDLSVPAVYGAIAGVMEDIGRIGISKSGRNQQQGFQFRGIDQVYAALNPILVKHKLMILPRAQDAVREHLTTAKGGHMNSVVMPVEFDLVCSLDGSKHTIRTIGEAMDSGDKASNKAMSAALKYAALQAFMIPIVGAPDADEETPDPVRRPLSDREKAELVIWRSNVTDQVAKAENLEQLATIKRGGKFRPGYDKLDEAGQAEIRKLFSDREDDFEPPLK